MNLDRSGAVFNEDRYKRYIHMHGEAVRRKDNLIKSLLFADLLLLIIVSGKNIVIPGITMAIADLPAALEIALVLSALTFLFLALTFSNEQAYAAIITQFNNRWARTQGIDPDFLVASDVYQELYLKLFRRQFNLAGPDFFTPGKLYTRFFAALISSVVLAVLALALVHVAITVAGISNSLSRSGWEWISSFCWLFATISNVVALLLMFTLTTGFNFSVESQPATSSQ